MFSLNTVLNRLFTSGLRFLFLKDVSNYLAIKQFMFIHLID